MRSRRPGSCSLLSGPARATDFQFDPFAAKFGSVESLQGALGISNIEIFHESRVEEICVTRSDGEYISKVRSNQLGIYE